jgi:hypothetical protein
LSNCGNGSPEYWRLLAVQEVDQRRERFIHRVSGKFFPRHPENLGRVAAALRPFHPRLRGLPTDAALLWDEATLRSSAILRLTTGMADLDLVARAASRRSAPTAGRKICGRYPNWKAWLEAEER